MIRRILRALICWAMPELPLEHSRQLANNQRYESHLRWLVERVEHHRQINEQLTRLLVEQGSRLHALENGPADKALSVRVARLEMVCLAPVHEWSRSTAINHATWDALREDGKEQS